MRFSAFIFVIVALSQQVFAQQRCQSDLPQTDPQSQRASEYLRGLHLPETSAAEPVSRGSVLAAFYLPCGFEVAWTSNGEPTPAARAVMDELRHADLKGLKPEDYGSPRWGSRACALTIQCDESPIEQARFDMDLTLALMRYLLDLSGGRVNPRQLKADFDTHPVLNATARFIWTEIAPATDVHATIQRLEPSAEGYSRVESALERYVKLQRAEPDVTLPHLQHSLRPGDRYEALQLLVARLRQVGDLRTEPETQCGPPVYQGSVVDGVKQFQSRHGLTADGILDARTYRELSVPIQQRAVQLALTLERWRWVQHSFSEAPVVINIPEYRLRAYDEHGRVALSMRVIVGAANHRKTPVLQGLMTTVIFRPYWNVPVSIQRGEITPKIARQPDYLKRNGFEVVDRHGVVVRNRNSESLLKGIRGGELRVRQIPGKQNALGPIKFVFPNSYNVYLHGTPLPGLFQQGERDMSHGCIRVEDPVALAVWALRSQQGLECPATFVPVEMRQTGMRGTDYGTRKEAYGGADRESAATG
jgi:L,D-transpeptidase YcbB